MKCEIPLFQEVSTVSEKGEPYKIKPWFIFQTNYLLFDAFGFLKYLLGFGFFIYPVVTM